MHDMIEYGADTRYHYCRYGCGYKTGPRGHAIKRLPTIKAAPVLLFGADTPPIDPNSRAAKRAYARAARVSA
jgi:hypothetical protein